MKIDENGLVDVGELKQEDAKVRITLYIDGDVLLKVREEADKQKMKYQTYINRLLREVLLGIGGKGPLEERVAKLEMEMQQRKSS